ncbi:hypothetical protein Bhyg_07904 [Pseudolycoriella hygida]|uniref:Uncharacterized protein n=1 Tax=Pseudolycoriella hygida TaxID=35572 RepID=A0A9Q0N3K3_9DIPT|nr:hypothetical protein Bhyg_07904 [Pseudolycoriella hygida]
MPALTGAERAKKHIEKLKAEGKYKDFKLKRIAIQKKWREKNQTEILDLPPRQFIKKRDEIRSKTNQRVLKHRKNYEALRKAKVREETKKRVKKHRDIRKILEAHHSSVYPNDASRRKAVSRAIKTLPKSLIRRKEVVKEMYAKYFDVPKAPKAAIPRPDISQQAPGRKDFVTIKVDSGEKFKVQKKYLIFPINDIYDKFCKEIGSVPLKRSKFFALRPKHIISSSKTPHNICLCIHHSNFNYAINAFKKVMQEMPQHGDTDFYETYFCEPITEDCYFGECKNCKGIFIDTILGVASCNKEAKVKWQAWVNTDKRWQNKTQTGTLETLANYIAQLATHFFKHRYINEEQLKSYRASVAAVKNDKTTAVMQIDFAENYKCIYQDEAGNAHWNQSQVSLFTAAIWVHDKMKSYSVVTDDSDHTKRTIVPYIDRLFEELPKHIKTIHIWSDGPSSQFKNKFIATALPVLEKKNKFKICWSFFAASHGKGPTDGTGGALKNQVWTAVKSREVIVCNAMDFSKAVNKKSKVKVMVMNSADVDQRNASLNLNILYEHTKPMLGIFDFHHLRVVNGEVKGFETTKSFVGV